MRRSLLIILAIIVFTAAGMLMLHFPAERDGAREPAQSAIPDSEQPAGLDAGLVSFHVQGIDGGEYTQDIFKDYAMTLVNVWGTYCDPCIREMPALGELYEEYVPKGVNIVGIVVDVQDKELKVIEEQRSLAQEIAEKTGADYVHLMISEEMIDSVLSRFSAIPASFFVDSDGNIISEFYIGAREKEEWIEIIEEHLEKL